MLKRIKGFMFDESGQGLVEYVLIIALIAIATIALLNSLGGRVGEQIQAIIDELKLDHTITPQ